MQKKVDNAAVRAEILRADDQKDVSVCLGVSVGAATTIMAMCGAGCVVMMRVLQDVRADIGGYWLAGVPLCFPIITGIALAYRRRMTAVSVHMGMLFLALLSGVAGYGYSIEPVYINSPNCTSLILEGVCHRENIITLYLVFGAVGLAACLVCFILSACACRQAQKRIQERRLDKEIQSEQNMRHAEEAKLAAAKKRNEAKFNYTGPVSEVTQSKSGLSKANGNYTHGASELSKPPIPDENGGYVNKAMSLDVTTKL